MAKGVKTKKTYRDIKKLPQWFYILPYLILTLSGKLLFRKKIVDPFNMLELGYGKVSVTWHNRLLYFPVIFPKKLKKKTVAVVSASRDGQYVADFIKMFGIQSMRGSSKKGGANALLTSMRALDKGFNVSFTPDGPRGPKYSMSKGPIHLASYAQTEIVPISINASRYWEIKSWDNFQIPKPFSTLTIVLGEPIKIPANLNNEEFEKYRNLAKEELMKITVD